MQQETLDYHLKFAWQNVLNKYNQIAAEFGISQVIGYMLINIDEQGTPVSRLAALQGVKATSLSRMLVNMENTGLIFREISEDDKRSILVKLTDVGKEKRKEAKAVVKKFNEYLNLHFTESESKTLAALLIKLNKLVIAYKED